MAASAELAVPVIEQPLYIGGAWRAATAVPIRVLDPTLEEPLADVPSATAAEVHAALESAQAAQAAWSRTSTIERGMHLRAIADLVAAHRDELAALLGACSVTPRSRPPITTMAPTDAGAACRLIRSQPTPS
jgi:acyl-CoA reductase-like NAD-dependent aldehyde dehydrogenase